MDALLAQTQAELAAARQALVDREAPIRAPLVAEEQRVAALRGQAVELRQRINALKLEANAVGVPGPSVFTEEDRLARIAAAVLVFVAAGVALGDWTPRVLVGGFIAAVAGLAWGLLRG